MDAQKPIRIKGNSPSSPSADTQRVPMSEIQIDLMRGKWMHLQQESDRLLAETFRLEKEIKKYKRDRLFRTIIATVIGAMIGTTIMTIWFLARGG